MTFEELKDEVIAWDDAHLELDVVTRDSIILERLFEKCNIKLDVVDGGVIKPCGALYLTEKVKNVFEEIVGKENMRLD